jgi:hypothetical protein
MDQKDTGGYASNNFWNGSGDSKTEGVNNAMRALNCLAALDIGGAFSYGYKGYGQYINSQRLDDLDSSAWKVKAALVSAGDSSMVSGSGIGSGASGGDSSSITGQTGNNPAATASPAASHMLSDMDHGFLYRGETGDIASDFEKKSGMSRETFFNELAATEASGLSWDDPNIMSKVEARYQSFISKIPNQDYKANIEKMHDMVSVAKKLDVFAKAADFYKDNRWGNGGDKLAKDAADAKASQAANSAGAGERNLASDPVALAAIASGDSSLQKTDDKAPNLSKDQMGMFLDVEGSKADELKDFIGPEETIFRVVSKRYRKLTPMMIGRAL